MWTSAYNGFLVGSWFGIARVVTSIETMETDDETVYYAMVEGSPTGIPLRNIILAE